MRMPIERHEKYGRRSMQCCWRMQFHIGIYHQVANRLLNIVEAKLFYLGFPAEDIILRRQEKQRKKKRKIEN